jgi:hypothetical protein
MSFSASPASELIAASVMNENFALTVRLVSGLQRCLQLSFSLLSFRSAA